MKAWFYNNSSDERVVNKSLANVYNNIDIYFKDDTSHNNPIFKVTGDYALKNINYIYVDDLKRYYYVRDIEYGKQCIYLSCHVDVLMSFKSDLMKQSAIINRNEYVFNLYQNDERMRLYAYDSIRTVQFPSGFDFSKQHFILGIAGSDIADGGE